MLHSAWATPAFIEVRAGEAEKRDGRDNRPLAERGQRGAIRLCPEPRQKKVLTSRAPTLSPSV